MFFKLAANIITVRFILNIADKQGTTGTFALYPFFNDGVVHLIIPFLSNRAASAVVIVLAIEVCTCTV